MPIKCRLSKVRTYPWITQLSFAENVEIIRRDIVQKFTDPPQEVIDFELEAPDVVV